MKDYLLIFLLFITANYVWAQNASKTRGVYKTFQDFKSGSITLVDSFYLDSVERKAQNWKGTSSVTPRYFRNHKQIKKIWGFSDGSRSFVHFQADFFPIEQHGHEFSFDGYRMVNQSGVIGSAIIFGAIGAGIYAAVVSDIGKAFKVKYFINPNNGDFHVYDAVATVSTSLVEKKIILYRGTRKENKMPMSFTVNGRFIDDFVPGSFRELNIPIGISVVEIHFGEDFHFCETIPFTDYIEYVECSFSGLDEKYKFKVVSKAEGEYSSVWSQDVQIRRERNQK